MTDTTTAPTCRTMTVYLDADGIAWAHCARTGRATVGISAYTLGTGATAYRNFLLVDLVAVQVTVNEWNRLNDAPGPTVADQAVSS